MILITAHYVYPNATFSSIERIMVSWLSKLKNGRSGAVVYLEHYLFVNYVNSFAGEMIIWNDGMKWTKNIMFIIQLSELSFGKIFVMTIFQKPSLQKFCQVR